MTVTRSPGSSGSGPQSISEVRFDDKGKVRRVSQVRFAFWALIGFLGLIQSWQIRHRIFSDGVPYLDIATYYAHGDWQKALNEYWSPLYSWILAVVFVIFNPAPYWQAFSLHVVNYFAYLASLVGFEYWLCELVSFQRRLFNDDALSEMALRIVSYTCFLIAGLLLIGIGYCSPDMIAMAIGFFLAYLLMRIESGKARTATYVWFGVLLAMGYLSRSAFLPVAPFYIAIAAALLWRLRVDVVRPLSLICATAILIAAPFVTALSLAKGRVVFSATGKPNYAWEVLGAARSTNWQGEPGDLGTPIHPSHKVIDHPATYTFASPVPGTYPLWYEPSYWYAGISPHFELKAQVRVLALSMRDFLYLFLRSPVPVLCLVLAFFMGWRKWLSQTGLGAFWFLLLPSVIYTGLYMLVYLDQRYIAGSLVIVWMCMLASMAIPRERLRRPIDFGVGAIGVLFCVVFLATRMVSPAKLAAKDLLHGHEDEWNQQWMLARELREIGVKPGDRVAYIGSSMDADWARLDGVRIVAEIPVIWERQPGLMRRVLANTSEIDDFWHAGMEKRERVYQAFREAGASIAVADRLPKDVAAPGWHRVLPPGTPHMAWSDAQVPRAPGTAYKWLQPPPAGRLNNR